MVELVWKFLRFYVSSSEISTGEDNDFVFFFFYYFFYYCLMNIFCLLKVLSYHAFNLLLIHSFVK